MRAVLTPALTHGVARYNATHLAKDAASGATVAAILIPNTLAYALLTGLPPVMGLYAALPSVLVAALWGSSRYTITAPVGIVSLLVASALTPFAAPQTPQFITLAIVLAVLTGMTQLLFGVLQLGVLTRLISHATLIGFTNAAALIIALTQLPAALGIRIPSGLDPLAAIVSLATHIQTTHIATAVCGIGTVLLVLLGKRTFPRIPFSLLCILVGCGAGASGLLAELGIAEIGTIPAGLPQFSFDAFTLGAGFVLLQQALLIAIVGFVETYSISQALAKKHNESVDADKELVGQGLANIVSGSMGGFPVSGSFSSSALNEYSGAHTRVAAVCTTICIFLALLFLSPVLSHTPRAVLAGVVIAAVVQLVNVRAFSRIYAWSRTDAYIAGITACAALIFKPDQGLFIGITLTIAYFILRNMHLRIYEVALHRTYDSLWTRESAPPHEVDLFPKTLLTRIDSSLIFSNADMLQKELATLIAHHEREFSSTVHAVVLHCAGINSIDLTGIENLLATRAMLEEKGTALAVMYVKDTILPQVTASGFFDTVEYIHGPHELRTFCENIEHA